MRKHHVVVGLILAIPVGMVGIIEIDRNARIREVLVIGDRIHLFVVTGARPVVVVRIQILAHGHVVFFREAVSSKRHPTVEFIKIFGIADAIRVAVQRFVAIHAVIVELNTRVSDIKR